MSTREYEMRDEERLPWLETVEDDYDDGPSVVRIVLLVVLALAIVAAAILGYQFFRQHQGVDGNGALIAAQEGDYKVKPGDPGGLKVDGEGDTAIATSNGTATGNASIDMSAAPEAPVAGKKVAADSALPGAGDSYTVVPVGHGRPAAAAPAAAVPAVTAASGTAGGALVQLGSFGSEAEAESNWSAMAKKFGYLAPLGKSVQAAQVNGRTVYRLRVNAGSVEQAASLCGKLSASGQPCFVPKI